MHLLYPSDPLRPKKCDEIYAAEFAAIQTVGLEGSLFSLEEFQGGTFRPFPSLPDSDIIYRGWMLSGSEYQEDREFSVRNREEVFYNEFDPMRNEWRDS